ncbi:MAG: iron-sulfur cluster co-chaperone HscB C-terminal domain-containing protein [Phycisphaerae bacterium]|nr:iron-sulfur cluster co-chaperone HscB C-terminal domain-containing protein [Phycisphaerae bacterium]
MAKDPISYPVRCSHCQSEMSTPMVCEACNTLQPVGDSAEAFELLQLPATYAIDLDELESVYLRLSRMVHPDYFGKIGGPERSLSEDLSARLNNAYRQLRDPLRRSEYLLARAGGPSATDDKRVPPDLLGEVMELREQIESAKAAGRSADLAGVNARLTGRADAAFAKLAQLHADLESAQTAGDDRRVADLVSQIRVMLNGIRYLQNLVKESRA